jgi:aldose sugar dehydrogenase
MRRHLIITAILALAAWGAVAQIPGQQATGAYVPPDYGVAPNAPSQKPAFPGQTDASESKSAIALDVATVAEGLVSPWGLAFLPDGRMLVTEKPGRLRIVAKDGTLSAPIAGLPMVDARGQGGLLDVTLDPNYAQNQMIYWSYAEPRDGGMNNTAVARGKLVDGAARASTTCR